MYRVTTQFITDKYKHLPNKLDLLNKLFLLHEVQNYVKNAQAHPDRTPSDFERKAQDTLHTFAQYMNKVGVSTHKKKIRKQEADSSFVELPGYFW